MAAPKKDEITMDEALSGSSFPRPQDALKAQREATGMAPAKVTAVRPGDAEYPELHKRWMDDGRKSKFEGFITVSGTTGIVFVVPQDATQPVPEVKAASMKEDSKEPPKKVVEGK